LKFPERGCARSVSRSASKMLRLVFDTASPHLNWATINPIARLDFSAFCPIITCSIYGIEQ
jgi:hypothetical protein